MTARDLRVPRARELSHPAPVDGSTVARPTARVTIVVVADGADPATRLAGLGAPDRTRDQGDGALEQLDPIVVSERQSGPSGSAVAALVERLSAAGPDARGAARAIDALHNQAAALLTDDGGPIAELTARLRSLDASLHAAREDEAAELALLDALLDAVANSEAERERDRLLAEREHWQTLIRLWPDWQALDAARRELAGLAQFGRLPSDLTARAAAVHESCAGAQAALRDAERRVSELSSALEASPGPQPTVQHNASDALRLHDTLPTYRAQLLELATARAQLSSLDRTLARGLERLPSEPDIQDLAERLTEPCRAELRRWHERLSRLTAARTAAERGLDAARAGLRQLSADVREELAHAVAEGDAEVDARWRSLWQLRTDLEEIWDVQSRAESTARRLRDREAALQQLAAARYWRPAGWLRRAVNALLVALAVGAMCGSVLQGGVFGAPLAGSAVVLALAGVFLHARTRWADVLEQRRSARQQRLRVASERLRRGCDADWARAAELTAIMRPAVQRLGLSDPVTLEAVETREQELAVELRAHGAETHLTRLLLALLDAQDEEPQYAAQLADADAALRALNGEWKQWRADAGLPADLDIARLEHWADEVGRLAAARVAHEAARQQLTTLEPTIAAWENEARRVLERAGVGVSAELCGRALASELTTLVARLRADDARRRERQRLEAELGAAQQQRGEAKAELVRARRARRALIQATRAGDEAGLRAQLEGVRRWREASERVADLEQWLDNELRARGEGPADACALLAGGNIEGWRTALCDVEDALEARRGALAGAAERRRAAELRVHTAATAVRVADLQLEREAVVAQMQACARDWQLCTLAAALLSGALHEHTSLESGELLRHAAPHLAILSGNRFTGLARDPRSGGLAVADPAGRHVPVDERLGRASLMHVRLSLVLGCAARLGAAGTAVPIVLDDALAALSPAEARVAAQEIARAAAVHPVFYLTTPSNRGALLSALPSDVTVNDA